MQRQISMPYRMETIPTPSYVVYDQSSSSIQALNNFVGRLNTATKSRLAGKTICVPDSERATRPTKLVRVTLGRGVTAWKAIPVDAD